VFVENVIGLPDQCPGPDREPVPIHIRYTNYELVDIFTTSLGVVDGASCVLIDPGLVFRGVVRAGERVRA
jgi:hypothetical protein